MSQPIQTSQPRTKRRWLVILINLLLVLAIIAGSVAAVWAIYRTEPTAQQTKARRKSAALVETTELQRGTYSPQLEVLGTVRPVQDIVLSPRVRGQVIAVSPSFVPGGMVRKGDMLLNIDPADFENTVSVRQSELEQVEADWEMEVGRKNLAKQELELLGDSIGGINRSLVLREPQSASLKSRLNAAKAALERAKIDLGRTKLIAPFDAQVLRRSVNVGSQVSEGNDLGQLVGIDQYWVIATIPLRNLRWIKFPTKNQPGSMVTLRNPDAWGPDAQRQGRVERMIGALDQQTRLARIVVTVDDPLGQKSDAPPLILDALIEANIEGVAIENTVRLDRDLVHDGDTVWIMKDNQLEIRDTKIVFRDSKYAYVSAGLESGDQVVITTLATVADGVQLRRVDEEVADPATNEIGSAQPKAPKTAVDAVEIKGKPVAEAAP